MMTFSVLGDLRWLIGELLIFFTHSLLFPWSWHIIHQISISCVQHFSFSSAHPNQSKAGWNRTWQKKWTKTNAAWLKGWQWWSGGHFVPDITNISTTTGLPWRLGTYSHGLQRRKASDTTPDVSSISTMWLTFDLFFSVNCHDINLAQTFMFLSES